MQKLRTIILLTLLALTSTGCVITARAHTPKITVQPGDGAEFAVVGDEEVLSLPLKVSSDAKFTNVEVSVGNGEAFWSGSAKDIPRGFKVTEPAAFQAINDHGVADIVIRVTAETPESVDDGKFFKIVHPAVASHALVRVRYVSSVPVIVGAQFPAGNSPYFVLHVDKKNSAEIAAVAKFIAWDGTTLAEGGQLGKDRLFITLEALEGKELQPLDYGRVVGLVADRAGHLVPFDLFAEVRQDTSGKMVLVPIPVVEGMARNNPVRAPDHGGPGVTVREPVMANNVGMKLEGGDWLNILLATLTAIPGIPPAP